MKSTYFQNFLIVLVVITIFISSLLAHTCIPLLAILGGFAVSLVGCRFLFKKWWNGADETPEWKKWLIAGLVAAVCSQFGWVALLI